MKIFLDDIRNPEDCSLYMCKRIGNLERLYKEKWCIIRNYKDFCNKINKYKDSISHISFDHDLADCFQAKETNDIDVWFDINENREYTGLDCAKYFKEVYDKYELPYPTLFVHSMNPIETENIIKLFK